MVYKGCSSFMNNKRLQEVQQGEVYKKISSILIDIFKKLPSVAHSYRVIQIITQKLKKGYIINSWLNVDCILSNCSTHDNFAI